MKTFALRIKPDSDLNQSFKGFAHPYQLQAGFVLMPFSNLKKETVRFAEQPASQVFEQKFEMVVLSSTLSSSAVHLPAAIADENGKTTAGRLKTGCTIYTTARL